MKGFTGTNPEVKETRKFDRFGPAHCRAKRGMNYITVCTHCGYSVVVPRGLKEDYENDHEGFGVNDGFLDIGTDLHEAKCPRAGCGNTVDSKKIELMFYACKIQYWGSYTKTGSEAVVKNNWKSLKSESYPSTHNGESDIYWLTKEEVDWSCLHVKVVDENDTSFQMNPAGNVLATVPTTGKVAGFV